MKVKDLLKEINKLIEEDPSVLEADLMQQSCFDDPYAWHTLRMYTTENYYEASDQTFLDEESAADRAEEDDTEVNLHKANILVLEAI